MKRPPIAASKIVYSDNKKVVLKYYDHKENEFRRLFGEPKPFMARLLEHILKKHFRMIRYFGFLSYLLKSKLLPKVYKALHLTPQPIKQI